MNPWTRPYLDNDIRAYFHWRNQTPEFHVRFRTSHGVFAHRASLDAQLRGIFRARNNAEWHRQIVLSFMKFRVSERLTIMQRHMEGEPCTDT